MEQRVMFIPKYLYEFSRFLYLIDFNTNCLWKFNKCFIVYLVNETSSDTNSTADLLITSHLDTSSSVTSSCLNPCSASAISSTLTVISANKIFEDRSPPDCLPIHNEQQTSKGSRDIRKTQ